MSLSPSPPPTQAGHPTQQSSRSRAGRRGNGRGLGHPPNREKAQYTWVPQGAGQATHCLTPGDTLHTDCKMNALDPGDEVALVLGCGPLPAWGSRASSSSSLPKTMHRHPLYSQCPLLGT